MALTRHRTAVFSADRAAAAATAVLVGCALLLVPAATRAAAAACPGIHVTILNIRNSIGTVDCALFNSPTGFPADVLRSAMRLTAMKVPNRTARCDFEDIPAGTYALVVLHDENMNARADYNWLGIPKEGYGFSKDAKGMLAAPTFSQASFVYDGDTLNMTITLRY